MLRLEYFREYLKKFCKYDIEFLRNDFIKFYENFEKVLRVNLIFFSIIIIKSFTSCKTLEREEEKSISNRGIVN